MHRDSSRIGYFWRGGIGLSLIIMHNDIAVFGICGSEYDGRLWWRWLRLMNRATLCRAVDVHEVAISVHLIPIFRAI